MRETGQKMGWWHGLSLKNQLRAISILVTLGTLILSTQAIWSIYQLHNTSRENIDRLLLGDSLVSEITHANLAFQNQTVQFKEILLHGYTHDDLARHKLALESSYQKVKDALKDAKQTSAALMQVSSDPVWQKGALGIESLDEAHSNVSAVYQIGIESYLTGNPDMTKLGHTLDEAVSGMNTLFSERFSEISTHVEEAKQSMVKERNTLTDRTFQYNWKITVSFGLIMIMGIGLLLHKARQSVFRHLGGDPAEVAEVVKCVATRDLSYAHNNNNKQGLLGDVFAMSNDLRKVLVDLHASAASLSNTSFHLAGSANQMAGTVDEQNNAVQIMQQATSSINLNIQSIAANSAEAQQIAAATQQAAERGAQIVSNTVADMTNIAQSIAGASQDVAQLGDKSRSINVVVVSIREIAEQTNLLALNAAIEAARAGEQGRGFAIVADEVRKLAERTAQATVQIQNFSSEIGSVVKQAIKRMDQVVADAKTGSESALRANESILEVGNAFRAVTAQVSNISTSLTEQGSMSRDLENNINRVAGISAELHTATRMIAETATNFAELAGQTIGVVSGFKLGNEKIAEVTLF